MVTGKQRRAFEEVTQTEHTHGTSRGCGRDERVVLVPRQSASQTTEAARRNSSSVTLTGIDVSISAKQTQLVIKTRRDTEVKKQNIYTKHKLLTNKSLF